MVACSGSDDDDIEPLVGRDDFQWSLTLLVLVPMAVLYTVVAVDRQYWSQILSLEAVIVFFAISPTFLARRIRLDTRSGRKQSKRHK